jgi:hypothetical protein
MYRFRDADHRRRARRGGWCAEEPARFTHFHRCSDEVFEPADVRCWAHCCPEPMRQHVRSWRKRTSVVIATRAAGQRIAALEAEVDALQRQALALDAHAAQVLYLA